MIGFALSTAPGYQIAGSIVSCFVKEESLLRWFGPHLNFATTPYHPRHVVSVASFALGIPAFIHYAYTTLWVKTLPTEMRKEQRVYQINAFNMTVSRTTIHLINALARKILIH